MDDTFDGTKGASLMHHKFVIIDGKTVLTSTANFTMSCIHGDFLNPGSRGNPNSLLVVQSAAMGRIFTEEFAQLWGNGRRGNFGLSKSYRGPQTVTVSGARITVQFSPTSRRFVWEDTVNGLIGLHLSRARRSVKAALFVFSEQNLADILQQSQARGAQMGFLIEPKFAYRDYSELLDMMGLQMLNRKCVYEPNNNPWKRPATEVGIPLLAVGDVLHHKFAVVDDRVVIVGSQNWSDAANYSNDETLLVIEDARVSDSFAREYHRLRKSNLLGPSQKLKRDIADREKACAQLGISF